jgi:hypothetical protein
MNPAFLIHFRAHDKNVNPRNSAAKQACERCKERRNPSADAHEKPMSDGEALPIVHSWASAIRYRPSLPFSSCALHFLVAAALATSGLHAAEPNIRVCVRLIELSHPELTKLLGESVTKLHPAAMALTRDGRAKLIDSSVLTTLSQRKATAESIGERIYPVEYEPHVFPSSVGETQPPFKIPPFQVGRPVVSAAWEIRNTGMTLEAEPSYDEDSKMITVRMAPEWVGMTTPTTWVEYVDEWGDASDRRPTFTTLRCNTALTLAPGRFALAAVLTPQPEPPPPAVARKVLVFVRADLPRQ